MPQPNDHRDSPVYWFAILDIARERGEREKVTEAQSELRRLGVDVRFRHHQQQRQRAAR